jgi:6-pyruvoyltetrahydropterin/6-carboxytetrahydropterin synthase
LTVKIVRKFRFDASHYLPGHPGKCKNLHGHSWEFEVEIEAKVDESTGISLDFSEIKKVTQDLLELLDHSHLNSIIEIPTAENIAKYIMSYYNSEKCDSLFGIDETEIFPLLRAVRVWESPDCYVEVV